MSATALLQKAAQMGATVSTNNNSNGVTEKSFVTSMAPPSFGMVQLQQQPNNGHSFMNHYMHQHDISSQYNNFNANEMSGGGAGNVGMNGVDMFNVILDQSKALSKIIEQNSRSINSGVLHPTNGGSSGAINIGGTKGSGDVMTLDLLGIGGGGGAHGNFYGGAQQAETAAGDQVWRNWSTKNAGFESFSATGSM